MLITIFYAILLAHGFCSVLIYSDKGTAKDLILHLEASLKEARRGVSRISASGLEDSEWEKDCKVLIIPGGQEKEYARLLSQSVLSRIRQFVEKGGCFLGICGGGYFASAKIEFEVGNENEIKTERELALFPGTAYGSAIPPFSYKFDENMEPASVLITGYNRLEPVQFYFMGGCYFKRDEVEKFNWKVVGTYAHNQEPAIIEGKLGKGKVILSGPHIEVDHRLMKGLETTRVYEKLKEDPDARSKAFNYVMDRLACNSITTRWCIRGLAST